MRITRDESGWGAIKAGVMLAVMFPVQSVYVIQRFLVEDLLLALQSTVRQNKNEAKAVHLERKKGFWLFLL